MALLSSGSSSVENGPRVPERCRPDYETMIARISERLGKELRLRDALLDYFTGKTANGKMVEIIGESVTQCNNVQRELDSIIKQQEAEDGK